MSSPTTQPIIVQILDNIADALASSINPANGFYTTVAGAGIEPLAFNEQDTYPRIVVQEESSDISDSNARSYQDSVVIAVHGFVRVDAQSSYRSALQLRADITRVLQGITKLTLSDANGNALTRGLALTGHREVVPSDVAQGFLEVIVRVACDYRNTSPPVSGI